MHIGSFVKQLKKGSNNFSHITDAIDKGTNQFREELDNKNMMLLILIHLHINKPNFSNFCELSSDHNNTEEKVKDYILL